MMTRDPKTDTLEPWEMDFQWLRIRHWFKDHFRRPDLPELKTILFLIGIQEVGYKGVPYTKEEKQDLMHVATCVLLSQSGYYRFIGMDADGWPHYEINEKLPLWSLADQENMLKSEIIRYFNQNINQDSDHE